MPRLYPFKHIMQKSYHIITFGCAMNFSDSERIAAILENQGLIKSVSKYEADLVIIVACAVRQHAMDRVFGNIGEIRKKNPNAEIIITGCILESDRKKLNMSLSEKSNPSSPSIAAPLFLSPSGRGSWRGCLTLAEFTDSKNTADFFKITPKYQYKNNACVPIMTGCNNFCSYCAVPYTRGREYSRPTEEIISEISALVKNGCKEITLLGQNVNSYISHLLNKEVTEGRFSEKIPPLNLPLMKGGGINFPSLLHLINSIPCDFKIKFLTSHPKDMSDELIDTIAKCDKIDKERIHLPVQHGDNEILEKMNRKYTIEHYKNLIKKIRVKLPDIKITTDIIVGFPGETKKQFENIIKLFQEIGFSDAYISCYCPRYGTAAAKMNDNVPLKEKRKRKKILEEIIKKGGI
ncbi:MAG: MiaB/RimO family radical SAM methylthiotransferase [bacterium]